MLQTEIDRIAIEVETQLTEWDEGVGTISAPVLIVKRQAQVINLENIARFTQVPMAALTSKREYPMVQSFAMLPHQVSCTMLL